MIKQLLIPIAAFAVTVTGVSAFGMGTGWIQDADLDLTDTQVAAYEEAGQIRLQAHEEAQGVLEGAGIDQEAMRDIHKARHQGLRLHHEAVEGAVEVGDYQAFLEAVVDSPMAGAIDNEAEFNRFVEAHELREEGDFEGAQDIFSELGLERPMGGVGHGKGGYGKRGGF